MDGITPYRYSIKQSNKTRLEMLRIGLLGIALPDKAYIDAAPTFRSGASRSRSGKFSVTVISGSSSLKF